MKYTVGAIYIGAVKSIGAALFAAILGHLKKTFSTFSFRIIYFRMLRIRILKINSEKVFFWVLILRFKKSVTKICRFFLSAVAFAPIDLEQ